MTHHAQQNYCKGIADMLPQHFNDVKVLEVGSLNINGSVRQFFHRCDYTGLDVNPGRDVDMVCKASECDAPAESFDTIISAECFEHDPEYEASVKNIMRMLKVGGLFVFTCATTGRGKHGTPDSDGDDYGPESGYYKNLTAEDFKSIEGWDECFGSGHFTVNGHDLYFYGIKQGE